MRRMKLQCEAGYNERLFESGFRRRFHLSRFEWVRGALLRAGASYEAVLDLGCFDGRSIEFLPKRPRLYLGLDANWERGLDSAKVRFRTESHFEFYECATPTELRAIVAGRRFDTSISLETLEHVAPELVTDYIRALSEVTTGHLAVTVPNEKGLVFLTKYLTKKLAGETSTFSASELVSATVGRMDRVERCEHKGFDYDTIVEAVGTFFDVLEVSGYPFRSLPRSAGFGVGILARARRSA